MILPNDEAFSIVKDDQSKILEFFIGYCNLVVHQSTGMQFYTRMPVSLQPFFKEALGLYTKAMLQKNLTEAWHQLERAHVIGQAYPYQHSLVHWKMLVFGCKIKSVKEILGQIPRLLVGGVKSFVGTIPVGNTGGANVPPMRSMPIQDEIKTIFIEAGVRIPGSSTHTAS
jgi:hypothetical protein